MSQHSETTGTPDFIGLFTQRMTPSLWAALSLNAFGLVLGLAALAKGILS